VAGHRAGFFLCMHKISRDSVRQPLLKDVYGKPHRQDKKGYISISHSRHMVAVMQSNRLAGLDIQVPEEKIARIQHKFISDRERCMLPKKNLLDYYHVFWGGKESMYKAYGKRELDFRKHMHLYPFRIGQGITELKGCVSKGDVYQLYDLEVDRVEQAYLVSCVMGE